MQHATEIFENKFWYANGGSRISQGAPTVRGVPTYYSTNFFWILNFDENEEILAERPSCVARRQILYWLLGDYARNFNVGQCQPPQGVVDLDLTF